MNASRVQVTRPRKPPDIVRSIKDSDTPQHHGNQPSHSKPLDRHLCRQSDSSAPIVSSVPVVTIYLWGLLYRRLKPYLGVKRYWVRISAVDSVCSVEWMIKKKIQSGAMSKDHSPLILAVKYSHRFCRRMYAIERCSTRKDALT
jgi:hypothetical protein